MKSLNMVARLLAATRYLSFLFNIIVKKYVNKVFFFFGSGFLLGSTPYSVKPMKILKLGETLARTLPVLR